MSKPTYVLGTSLSHDGASCLLRDGSVVVAIEKERLTRVKHDGYNDADTIRYCLEAEGIGLDDVDVVVQNANFGMLPGCSSWFHGERPLGDHPRIVTISHHLAHAYSAFATSQFESGHVLVIDGCGSSFDDCLDLAGAGCPVAPPAELRHLYFEKDSYYAFAGNKLRPVYKDFSPWGMASKGYPLHPSTTLHSIGGLYLAVSKYVFANFEDPGKLMGLAPYGRRGAEQGSLFDLSDGRVFLRYDWMRRFDRPCRSPEEFKARFQELADLARWVQDEVERAICYLVDMRYALEPSDALCLAGGVALNAVANARVANDSRFARFYAQPAAGDNGVAIGCAYYGWLEVLGGARVPARGHPFLGRAYDRDAIERAVEAAAGIAVVARDNPAASAAALLAAGKVIGWMQGGSEFGPRALGHRSILADPRIPGVRDRINLRVKFREDFRPFAPAVLAEDASIYFDPPTVSPHMLLVSPVKPEWREHMPGVVHVDGSARLQTVGPDDCPELRELLERFKALTGLGVVLNTSLNRRRMPIVETPEQALDLLAQTDLDALVLGHLTVERR